MEEPGTGNREPRSAPEGEIAEILISAEAIQARVRELAAAISRDYAGKDPLLVGILRGAGALRDKGPRRIEHHRIAYCGFQIPDKFVVGYGLDYHQRHRTLPYVAV